MTNPQAAANTPRTAAEMEPIERRFAEAWHELNCGTDHPITDHEPFDREEGDIPWPEFVAVVERHGLRIIEDEAAAPTPAEPLDRVTIERACIAVVGPWFDESHERGSFRPMELAQRILREADRLAAARPEAER